jgi:CBS domain-containing protein
VRRDTNVQEIVATMSKYDISSIIVVEEKRPIGIVTHKDIISKLVQARIPPDAVTAREVMNSPVITINEESSVEEAARLMSRKRIKKLIVTRNNNELAGIITSSDIVREAPKMTELLNQLLKR